MSRDTMLVSILVLFSCDADVRAGSSFDKRLETSEGLATSQQGSRGVELSAASLR